MKLCSACLLGIRCRYDGKNKPNKKVIKLTRKEFLIPVCPEQLGGLSTPREPALKQRSPSCGRGQIYDGTFSGKIVKGDGVTATLLKKNGIKVISEEDL